MFIGLFSLIIAATTGLLIAKGAVTTAMTLPAQITYGTGYAPTPASAFMSSVSYEYSLEGSGEWSSEQPVKAGKYLARTVTDRTFGKGYSDPVRFEITPLEVTFSIGAERVVYGGVPEGCSISATAFSDRLETGSLKFEYDSYTAQRTGVSVIESSVRIINAEGEDITSCYEINFEDSKKELEIIPRAISIQPESVVTTYSDTVVEIANEVNGNSLSQLVNGDKITVENGVVTSSGLPVPAPKNRGDYKIEIGTVRILHGDEDVTHQYNVTKLAADLIINARNITITTGSDEKVYDGDYLGNDTYTYRQEELVPGHSIFALYGYPSIIDAGEIDNINTFEIYSEDENVTENYNIKTVYGKLKISKRSITVKTATDEREYDGQKLYNYDYDIISQTQIVEGQLHNVINDYGIYNVSENGYNLLQIAVYDSEYRDITELNYDITYVYGTLTLLKRDITVQTGGGYKIYDGNPLDNTELTVDDRLVTGHSAEAVNYVSVTNAGSQLNAIEVRIYNGYEEVTANYNITYDYGTLTVDKRPISVTTGTFTFVFDGESHSYDGYETRYYGEDKVGLVSENDKLVVSDATEIEYVGESENVLALFDESGNYDIKEIIYGKLYMTARPIRVVMGDAKKEYDGTPLTNFSYRTNLSGSENEFGLVKGDELILVEELSQITNVGTAENKCPYVVPNDNYEIVDIVKGELIVYERAITVELLDITVLYGSDIEYPSGSSNIANADTCRLAAGEEIEVFVIFQIDEGLNGIGAYSIIADEGKTKITNAEGTETTSNYIISYKSSTLTIESQQITVKTQDNVKIYDGEPLENGGYSAIGILAVHEVYLIEPYSIVNVDESGEDRAVYGIRDKDTQEDVTGNYVITFDYGYLTVTARPITVKTVSDSKVYDATPLENTEYTTYYFENEAAQGLLGGDELILVSSTTISNVGDGMGIKNACKYEVPNSNYEIKSYDYGTLKITAREIIVYTDSAEKVYDKTPLTCDTYTTKYRYNNAEGLLNGDKLIVTGALASVTDVGDGRGIENRYEFKVPNSNYEIYGRAFGILKITPRPIVVVTDGTRKEYDGTPLVFAYYTTYLYGDKNQPGLIVGDGKLTLVGEPASITNVGSTDNVCDYEVPSNNYEIADYEYGTLLITPKPIEIGFVIGDNITYGETFEEYPANRDNYSHDYNCLPANGEHLQIAIYYELNGVRVEKPKNAGDYKVRLDFEKTVVYDKNYEVIENGISNYDVTVIDTTRKILPLEVFVEIEFAEIDYGEGEDFVPTYSQSPYELPYGEEIRFVFVYRYFGEVNLYNDIIEYLDAPRHAGVYGIYTDGTTVYLDGSEVADGINNYDVYISANHATVTVNPKEITVELLDIEGIEYGDSYSYPVYEGNYKNSDTLSLPYGEMLTLFDSGIRNDVILSVGTHYGSISVDETKTLVNGIADTSDYIIEYINGDLEIVQRQIIVTNPDAEKVYDGTSLANGRYTTRSANDPLKEGLLYDDELELIGELISITVVSESGTVNSNRYTVSPNYEITDYEDGQLVITQRKIVIATENGEWEYDGKYHSIDSFNAEESYHFNEETGENEPALVLDHYFVALTPAKIKDVGTIRNVSLGENEIFDGEDTPVTDNYEIDVTNSGYLTVTPRHIVVKTFSDSKVYDGTPLTCEVYSTYYYQGNGAHYTDESEKGLVEGDELVRKNEQPIYATYVWENSVLNMNEYESPVGEYGNANYVIEYTIFGYLTVTHREITVEIGDKSMWYDVGPYNFGSGTDNYANFEDCDLAEGEKLHIEVNYTDAEGKIITDVVNTRFNVGVYGIVLDLKNCAIYRDGEILERGMENYSVICDGSVLTVTQKKVTITINDSAAVYGDDIEFNGYQGGENIPYFHGVQEELSFSYGFYFTDENGELELLPERIRVGTYVIHVDMESVLVNGESPSNYEFTFIDGILVITPKEVEITLKDQQITYGDGFIYPDGADSYQPVELPYGDTLEVFIKTLEYGKLNAGKYPLEADGELTLVNGEADTSDYIFTFIESTLTVERRGITVKLNAPDRTYTYGEIYTYSTGIGNYEFVNNLAYEEQLEVVVKYVLNGEYLDETKNVGAYDVILSDIIIYDEFGYDPYDGKLNYYVEDIASVVVHLSVVPKEITIKIDDSEYIYGNEDEFRITYSVLDTYSGEETELPFGEVLTFGVLYTLKTEAVYLTEVEDAGEYYIWSDASLAYIDGKKDGIGNYGISVEQATLTIHKRQIVVETNTSSHVYDGLKYWDTTVNSYFYNENDPENRGIAGFVKGYSPEVYGEIPTVTNVSEGAVENKFEFTVSSNYEIVGEINYGTIFVTPRDLTVELNSYEIIYGEEFSYAGAEDNYLYADNLVAGDKLEISAYFVVEKAVPDVGTYAIKADEEATLINGVADTSNYKITYIDGWLEVTVRTIVITTASGSWEYDGEAHSAKDGNPEESYYINAKGEHIKPALVEGHRFEAGEYPTITNVGKIVNTCYGGDIFDSENNPVTSNYYIDMDNSGTLEITPRIIEVTTGSDEKEYDGTELFSDKVEITYGTIAEGQSFEVTFFPLIVNVAQTAEGNNNAEITVYGADGENVTDNYSISYVYGTLSIIPRKIVVRTADDSKVYDSTPLRKATGYTTYHFGYPEEEGLLNGDTLALVGNAASITDFGSIENACRYRPVSGNYEIMEDCYEYGTLTILKRHITVVTDGNTKMYDGTPLYDTGYTTYLTDDSSKAGLLGSDKLILDEDSIVYITEVGESSENTLRFTVGSENYEIDGYEYGYLEVTQRRIIVITATDSKIYDGTPLENYTDYTVILDGDGSEGLLGDDSLTVIRWTSLTNVKRKDTGEVTFEDNICLFEVPNGNYHMVEIRCGTLTVYPAPLKVVLEDVENVPYGQSLTYPQGEGNYVSAEKLVNGETLEVSVYYTDVSGVKTSPVSAGKYYVYIDLENSKVSGSRGLGNYDVDCDFKTATVEKLTLKVELTHIMDHTYDSTAHTYNPDGYTIDGDTVGGEILQVSVKYYDETGRELSEAPKNAGTYYVELDVENCKILKNGSAMPADINYEIECDSRLGYVITPAEFYVVLSDLTGRIYSGTAVNYTNSGGFEVYGLFGTDSVACTVKYYRDGVETEPVNAGEYTVEFDTENIKFSNGKASNYTLDKTRGNYSCKLIITPRPILVTVADREIEYTVKVDPNDESYKATLIFNGMVTGGAAFVGEDEQNAGASYLYDGGTTLPSKLGTYQITVVFTNEEIMSNYSVTVYAGTLTIVGRKVLVVPVYTGGSRVYDGNAINVEELVSELKLGFTHVHNISGAAEDDKYGFTEEDLANLTVIYEFEEATSHRRYTDGATPKDAGNYYIHIRVYGYDPERYSVEEGSTLDYLIIRRKDVTVSSISDVEKVYDKQAPEGVEIFADGILEVDRQNCTIVPKYLDENGYEINVFNAGTYVIEARIFDESGADNYNLVYADGARGTLTITPVTLYIRPQSKSEYYSGANISLGAHDYEFVDGEHSGLVEGDEIWIIPSTELDPSKTYVTVSIVNAGVKDIASGADMTGNYKLYYAYDRNLMGSDYNSGDFKGSLEYLVRNVYYVQIVSSGERLFAYDGLTKKVDGSYEIVEGKGEGLFASDRIVISSTTVGPQVGRYYDWLKLKVYNKNGKDVSKVYNLRLENPDESFVTIGVLDITLNIDAGLTDEMLEDESTFYTVPLFDGRLALDKRYYNADETGVMDGHELEVIAIKSHGVWNFAVVIYEVKASGALTNKSDCYNLIVVKEDSLGVECTLIDYHLLTDIQSDITFILKASYEDIVSGEGLTVYDNRPALNSAQYEIKGLLPDHASNTQVAVIRSNGVLTLAVLITNGKSDRSYYYYLNSRELPEGFPEDGVAIVLVANLMEVRQDVTISITASLDDINAGTGLEETYDGKFALSGSYTVSGLLTGHTVQIIPVMTDGEVLLAVLIFEARYNSGGAMSGRSDKSYLYNLIVEEAPADVRLVSSLNEILTDIRITLDGSVTAENLKNGVGVTTSAVDRRRVLSSDMFTIENNFGRSPLALNHELEIIVEADGDTVNLYIIVYQLSSAGKRSDRSYYYSLICENADENINVIYKSLPLGNEGLN